MICTKIYSDFPDYNLLLHLLSVCSVFDSTLVFIHDIVNFDKVQNSLNLLQSLKHNLKKASIFKNSSIYKMKEHGE